VGVCLTVSLGAGLIQLETTVTAYQLNMRDMDIHVTRKRMREVLANPEFVSIEETTSGQVLDRLQAQKELATLDAHIRKADESFKRLQRKGLAAYRVRNIGLIFGFASLVAWKIITLYTTGTTP